MTEAANAAGRIKAFFRSFPGRLIVSTLGLTALFGTLLLTSVLYVTTQLLKDRFTDEARDHAREFAALIGQDPDLRLESEFRDLVASGHAVYAEFIGQDAAGPAGSLRVAKRPGMVFVKDASFGEHGDGVYYLAETVRDGSGKTIGSLRLGYDEGQLAADVRHVIHRSIVFALVYVWALLLAAASQALRLTNPIKSLQTASRDIASGQIDKVLNISTHVAEIASLAEDLEHMRQELVSRSKKIAASEARNAAILAHAADGIVTLDQDLRVEGFNKAAERLFGYGANDILGTPVTRLLVAGDAARFVGPDGMVVVADDARFTGLRKNGETFPLLVSTSAVHQDDATLFILVAQDISERIAHEEKLANLAYYDTLTGLPNRRLFHDRLQHAVANTARSERLLAVFFLDLDGFKFINDTFGHRIGDLLLQAVAERLSFVVRSSDTVSRLGGDEFTLILANIAHMHEVEAIANKILKSFAKPFILDGHEIYTSTSIGISISICPFDNIDAGELVKQADTAMYFAKKSGKNAYRFYSEEMEESAPPLNPSDASQATG